MVKNLPANAGDISTLGSTSGPIQGIGKIPWRRKWQLTPVFLLGKSHGQRSLAGYSPWGCKRVQYDLAKNNNNDKSSARHIIDAQYMFLSKRYIFYTLVTVPPSKAP